MNIENLNELDIERICILLEEMSKTNKLLEWNVYPVNSKQPLPLMRQDIERQKELEPERIELAKQEIEKLGFEITFECSTRLEFEYKNKTIMLYPYSGWHTGQSIKDGRGLDNLLKQIK